jgi:hypothetical protein
LASFSRAQTSWNSFWISDISRTCNLGLELRKHKQEANEFLAEKAQKTKMSKTLFNCSLFV